MLSRRYFRLLAGAVVIGIGMASACRREPVPQSFPATPRPTAPVSGSDASVPDTGRGGSVAADVAGAELLPIRGGVQGYTGSDPCRECHLEQHASWHRSFHRTMTQWPIPEAVKADFNHAVLTNDSARYILTRRSNEFWVHIESALATELGQRAPEPVDVPLGLVTGSHHMQVFWVGNGAGNTQLGFPFTWLIPEQRWVPRNTTFLRPPTMPHRPEVWNIVCSRCHATGTEPHIDRVNRAFNTRVAEPGISCEACHGPGERHAAIARSLPKPAPGKEAPAVDLAIVHPEKIPPVRSSQICGFCHSMKWYDRSSGWGESGFTYRPGDDLEQTTPVIRAASTNRPAALLEYLARNPSILTDFFWPDGMIRVSGREYNGLIESPCYQAHRPGKAFSCLSCHSLHDSEPDDQLARNKTGNRACLSCHETFRESAALAAHTHHREGSSGSDCANCHMPHTTYGVLKAIRSHQISSPEVGTELATGRPNACNLCHLDRSLTWTAGWLSEWYRRPVPAIPRGAAEAADSIRLGLSGDAGQRVLIAWHLGWPEAARISGTNWMSPVLDQLLRDPYAAVRCVAERSARALGMSVRGGYDYVVSPELGQEIPAVPIGEEDQAEFLKRAGGEGAWPGALLAWLRQRDDRDVRLRE